jgi:hypothetical protein
MIPFRSELRPFLEEFVETHRGARLGKMFGLPALYAGRRLFACLIEDGMIVRLAPEIARREIRNGAKPFSNPSTRRSGARAGRDGSKARWMMYRPRSIVAARRLVPLLELAAREVARRQVEEMTGVRLRQK